MAIALILIATLLSSFPVNASARRAQTEEVQAPSSNSRQIKGEVLSINLNERTLIVEDGSEEKHVLKATSTALKYKGKDFELTALEPGDIVVATIGEDGESASHMEVLRGRERR